MFKYQNREVSKGSMHSGKETTWDGSYLSTAASVQYPYVQLRLVAVRFCFCWIWTYNTNKQKIEWNFRYKFCWSPYGAKYRFKLMRHRCGRHLWNFFMQNEITLHFSLDLLLVKNPGICIPPMGIFLGFTSIPSLISFFFSSILSPASAGFSSWALFSAFNIFSRSSISMSFLSSLFTSCMSSITLLIVNSIGKHVKNQAFNKPDGCTSLVATHRYRFCRWTARHDPRTFSHPRWLFVSCSQTTAFVIFFFVINALFRWRLLDAHVSPLWNTVVRTAGYCGRVPLARPKQSVAWVVHAAWLPAPPRIETL